MANSGSGLSAVSTKLLVGGFTSILALSLFGSSAHAFPEMIRHGYANCTTCHVSPAGGGVINEYGRALSEEILSTWKFEGEGGPAHGQLKLPSWLNLGGDVRVMGVVRDTYLATEGRAFLMQADAEAAVTQGKLTGAARFGYYANDLVQSRKHYLMYQLRDEATVRAGRFKHVFGIQTPDHVIATKRGLGWDETADGSESYNLELAWSGEKFSAFATGIFGRPDAPDLNRETGLSLRPAMTFNDTYQVGLSYFYGANSDVSRHIGGVFGSFGFTPRFFLLSELDVERRSLETGTASTALVTYQRLNYEVWQGVHSFVTFELMDRDLTGSGQGVTAYGAGLQFFPRPHFELALSWQKQILFLQDTASNFGWLMLHYYL